MDVRFYELDEINISELKFVVIISKYKDKWVLVKHKERVTWEIPGGHIEFGEDPKAAAKRELNEETGALKFDLKEICNYGVKRNNEITYGRLYFTNIDELGILPDLEIEKIQLFRDFPLNNLTYPGIQPKLFDYVFSREH